MTHTHFREDERLQLKILKDRGYSNREIGRAMGRSHTSIGRELKRNKTKGKYDAVRARAKARNRRKCSKYQGMKVMARPELREYIIKYLNLFWTPEEIAGRLKEIDTHLPYISSKGIYKWLYSNRGQRYCNLLPKQRFRPRKRKVKKTKRVMIPNRIDINERPPEANNRTEFGHAETDTMVSGKRHHNTATLSVICDRKARYTRLRKMKSLKPKNHNAAIESMARGLRLRTLTYDNGIENRYHEKIAKSLSIKTYFCRPYHSWEKGTVENTIGRIRRFIPKGANVADYSHQYIARIEHWLNHTPRKCLNFRTPYEIMHPYLSTSESSSGAFEG